MIRKPLWPVFVGNSTRSGTWRAPLPRVLLCSSLHQAHRGAPLTGVLLQRVACQALNGAPWVGSYSVVQCIRHLTCQPLSVVQLRMLSCGETEAIVMAPPTTRDSAVSSCFHGFLAFLHRHFPPQSSPSPPLTRSLQVNSSPCPGIAPHSPN